jgi:hypothetical protein
MLFFKSGKHIGAFDEYKPGINVINGRHRRASHRQIHGICEEVKLHHPYAPSNFNFGLRKL